MKRPSVVCDTNVLVSGLIVPKSKPGQIIRLWKRKKIEFISSPPLLTELETVLNYPKFFRKYSLKNALVHELVAQIRRNSQVVFDLKLPKVIIRDTEDVIVLATALDGHADYLVTGDNDLLAVKNNPSISPLDIITVNEFITLFERGNRF